MTKDILITLSILLLSGMLFVAIHMVLRQLRSRIDIVKYINGAPVRVIAFVKHSQGKAAEAYLPGGGANPVGRIIIEKSGDKAIVQILQSDVDEETSDPVFKRSGYIGEDAFIYAQSVKNGPVRRVGYVAQPSKPDVPCMKGERSWKTLWLHACLDVYLFKDLYVEEVDIATLMKNDAKDASMESSTIRRDQSGLSLDEIIDDIKRHMVFVEGGSFTMGAPRKEEGQVQEDGKERGMVEDNESPEHQVTLDDYCIGQFPVTQAEWKAIMGENPSDCQDDLNYPVSPVSWAQCQAFIEKLNSITGLHFSLPTEAQWEYAARGGKKSRGLAFSGSAKFSDVGWGDHKHPVGTKTPNELGIYDMSGLVREWCSDIWGHYSEEAQTNPVGPSEDSPLVIKNSESDELYRVVRSPSGNETVTNRKGENPILDKSFKSYGIRLAYSQVSDLQVNQVVAEVPEVPAEPKVEEPLSSKAEMIARCDKQGSGAAKSGAITSEARAAAYALFAFSNHNKQYEEYFSEPKYGWRDTALLASLCYTIGFTVYYLVNTSILQRPLIGWNILAIFVLYGFYFVVWGLIRSIKIERIESGDSFQPQLDLLNKSLGQKRADICLILLGLLAIPLSIYFFELDFIPLLMAIVTGVFINKMVRDVATPWKVKKSYSERPNDEPEADEDGEWDTNQPPMGDIVCTFDWDLDYEGLSLHGNVNINFDADKIREQRQNNPFYSQNAIKSTGVVKKMFDVLCHRKDYMERTRYLAKYIMDTAARADLAEHVKLQFALDFIQEPNIRFVRDKESERIQYALQYMRFPDETLFDKEGDYDCKTFLAALLFHAMGYDVLFLHSSKHDHYLIAVEERYHWTDSIWRDLQGKYKINWENKDYVICETTADHFKLGDLLSGITPDDFDFREHFPHAGTQDDQPDIVYRTYDWDFKNTDDTTVHGMSVLGFNTQYITELRRHNPFHSQADTADLPLNEKTARMVRFLTSEPRYTSNLREIAHVVKEKFPEAGLTQISFAQNFVLEPNIRACDDAKSAPIAFQSVYIRFPDETLFDKEGDDNCQAFLLAMLYGVLGYDIQLLASKETGRFCVVVECKSDQGSTYYVCGLSEGKVYPISDLSDFDVVQEIQKINE